MQWLIVFGGGLPYEKERGRSSEKLNLIPKGEQSGRASRFTWPVKGIKTEGLITSPCLGKPPALVDRTREDGRKSTPKPEIAALF